MLLNLLGNAVKYTDAGSVELRVLAGAAPGGLRIEVADTGRGIDEAGRDRLFQDFERLDAAASVEGAGLGLAIAARIIAADGRRRSVMSPTRAAAACSGWRLPAGERVSPAAASPRRTRDVRPCRRRAPTAHPASACCWSTTSR